MGMQPLPLPMPAGGNSYNQLAVLATHEQDELGAAFYYLRCLLPCNSLVLSAKVLLNSKRLLLLGCMLAGYIGSGCAVAAGWFATLVARTGALAPGPQLVPVRLGSVQVLAPVLDALVVYPMVCQLQQQVRHCTPVCSPRAARPAGCACVALPHPATHRYSHPLCYAQGAERAVALCGGAGEPRNHAGRQPHLLHQAGRLRCSGRPQRRH